MGHVIQMTFSVPNFVGTFYEHMNPDYWRPGTSVEKSCELNFRFQFSSKVTVNWLDFVFTPFFLTLIGLIGIHSFLFHVICSRAVFSHPCFLCSITSCSMSRNYRPISHSILRIQSYSDKIRIFNTCGPISPQFFSPEWRLCTSSCRKCPQTLPEHTLQKVQEAEFWLFDYNPSYRNSMRGIPFFWILKYTMFF